MWQVGSPSDIKPLILQLQIQKNRHQEKHLDAGSGILQNAGALTYELDTSALPRLQVISETGTSI